MLRASRERASFLVVMQLGNVLDSLNGTATLAGLASGEKTSVKTSAEAEPFVDQVERVTHFIVAMPATLDAQDDPRPHTLQIRGFTSALLGSVAYAFDLIAAGVLQVTDAQRERLESAKDDLEEMIETFNLTLDHFETIQSAIAAER